MAKKDKDLFDRLRNAGLRKQVAKTLSELSDDASKKAARTARSTVSELRSIADEIERRLPTSMRPASAVRSATRSTASRSRSGGSTARKASSRSTSRKRASSTATRSRSTTRRASKSSAASTSQSRRAPASSRRRSSATATKRTAASSANAARAPRGANKQKILRSLASGPKTASEIAKETGIGAGTVGSTLSKMAIAGEVRKADRGYGLPS